METILFIVVILAILTFGQSSFLRVFLWEGLKALGLFLMIVLTPGTVILVAVLLEKWLYGPVIP